MLGSAAEQHHCADRRARRRRPGDCALHPHEAGIADVADERHGILVARGRDHREAADEFAGAIRRKLILEIASARPQVIRTQLQTAAPRIDCLIGEKLWQRWRGGP